MMSQILTLSAAKTALKVGLIRTAHSNHCAPTTISRTDAAALAKVMSFKKRIKQSIEPFDFKENKNCSRI